MASNIQRAAADPSADLVSSFFGAPAGVYFAAIGAVLLIFAALAWWYRKRVGREAFAMSLDMVLMSVRIPPISQEEVAQAGQTGRHEKDWMRVMEDFYANLVSLKSKGFFGPRPWITLEIAKVRGEICFYVAAPRQYASFIEKKINSIYHDAEVAHCKDFNIFGTSEKVFCGFARTVQPVYLPLKTYGTMEIDPLSSLTNVLTKLGKEEEAVVQIVVRDTTSKWYTRGRQILREVGQGKNIREAIAATNLAALLATKTEKQKEQEAKIQRRVDEELVKAMEAKLNKQSFDTNIRIVVSINDERRSEEVFTQLAGSLDQFSAPNLNKIKTYKASGRARRRILNDFIFRNFDEGKISVLSTEELTSIFHFPTPFLKTPNVKILNAKAAPAPVNLPADGLLLGYNLYRGEKKDAYMTAEDRRRHLYVIGQTGTGKSAFLSGLIEQDVAKGDGVGVLDPHGDLIDDILGKVPNERLDDVVIFDPSNLDYCVGLNMLEYDTRYPEQKTFIINEFIKIFDKLYDLKATGGPMFEQYCRNALQLLMDDPKETYTLMEVPKVLADKEFRHYLLAKCRNVLVKEFWEKQAEAAGGEASLKNMVPYITSKFDTFISNDYMRPIIGQVKSTFNFREILDQKKIFMVNLSKGRLGDLNSSLLGLIITSKLTIAAFSRVDTPESERKDFYLYLDEFQNFATDTISTILSEARKYKLCLNLSHQFIGQLPDNIRDSVFGNIGSIVSFRVGVEDSEFLAKQFAPVINAQDLNKNENYSAYVRLLIKGLVATPFSIRTYPPHSSDRERMNDIKEYYSLKYGTSRDIVEEEIDARRTGYNLAAKAPLSGFKQ